MKKVLVNKRAKFEYQVLETLEAGVVLSGAEVKSLRLGRGSLAEAHVVFLDGEAQLINMNIPGYQFADLRDYDPVRTRKLLLHKKEVESLSQKTQTRGISVVPLSVYVNKGKLKLEIGLVRGKKQFEKREEIKKRDLAREVKWEFKQRLR